MINFTPGTYLSAEQTAPSHAFGDGAVFLLSGKLGFIAIGSTVSFSCRIYSQTRAAFARRRVIDPHAESRRGKSKKMISPGPPRVLVRSCYAAAYAWRLRLLRVALNLRLQRKQPIAKSPLVHLCRLNCSRSSLEERMQKSALFRQRRDAVQGSGAPTCTEAVVLRCAPARPMWGGRLRAESTMWGRGESRGGVSRW